MTNLPVMNNPGHRFDAKNLSDTAHRVCEAQHLTPRWFEVVNSDKPSMLLNLDDDDYPVLIVGNSRRSITITAGQMLYANENR